MLEAHPFARVFAGLRVQASVFRWTPNARPSSSTSNHLSCLFQSSCQTSRASTLHRPRLRCNLQDLKSLPRSESRIASSYKRGRSHCTTWEQRRGYVKAIKSDSEFGEMTEEQYLTSKHRFKKLSAKDVHKIFGPGMDARQGNHLLNTVQKQRVTGTLDMNISGPNISKATVTKSLSWLREHYPFDEDAAIMIRLEREEATVQDWKPQGQADPENPYNGSVLDEIRAKNVEDMEKRNAAAKAEAKAEAKRLAKEGKSGALAVRDKKSFKEVSRSRATAEWVDKYKKRATLSDATEPPKPPVWLVLGPTGIFALCLIILAAGVAMEYEPPAKAARIFPNIPPAAATVGALIGLNVLFFLCWRIPPFWRFMNLNMLLIPATPHAFSLLGNIFSHQSAAHLLLNMLGLWFVGTSLHDEVGRGKFLAIYLGCGVFASWCSLLRFVIIKNYTFTSLGASGAIFGIIATLCTLYPEKMITIAFLPEDWQRWFCVPAKWIFWGLFTLEAANVARRSWSADHMAHLSGLIAGVCAAEALKWQSRARRKRFIQPSASPPRTR